MKHILLIEPNTVLAQTYVQALRHSGYSVAAVTGAQAAVNAADEQAPDVVILELQLIAHNGIEFLHEFRSYPEWRTVPVIVNTLIPPTRIGAATQALTTELGVSVVLYKPRTSQRQLLRHVREQLAATA